MVLPHLSFLSMALQVIDLCPEDWAVVIATRGQNMGCCDKEPSTNGAGQPSLGPFVSLSVDCMFVQAARRTNRKFKMQLTIVEHL